jgi:hypothetical protein
VRVKHLIALFVSAYAQEERPNSTAAGVVACLERSYAWAEEFADLLSRVTLWPVLLLFIPKINLISFGEGETAGIRLDDAVLLCVLIILICSSMAELRFKVDSVAAAALAVIALFCLSNLVNSEHSNVLYSLRLMEYLVFFWAGKSLIRAGHRLTPLVKILIALNGAAIFLQLAGVIGGFAAEGYQTGLERPFGLSANHPAEMGALLNLLFAQLAFEEEEKSKSAVRFWCWCLFTAVVIFITGSRSALFCHCVLTLAYVYRHARNKMGFVLKSAFISGAVIAVIVFVPNSLRERSADLFSVQNVEAARQLYDTLPAEKSFTGFAAGSEAEDAPEDVDASLYMRGFKWTYVTKIMFTAPRTVWILGLGPGALGPALDGGWLRLLAETGVVGTLAFIMLLRKIWSLSYSCAMAVLALAINMLMVDSQNAYKVMAFLFLLAGTQVQKQIQECMQRNRRAPRLILPGSSSLPEQL